jgi:hypothetical protein
MDILEDNNFFRQLGLIKMFQLKLDCNADNFRELFQGNVTTGDSFKDTYFSKNDYTGTIRRYSFDIHKSLKFPDHSMSMFGAKGTYSENGDGLSINVAVYLPIGTFMIFIFFILLWNIALVVGLLTSEHLQQYTWTIALICSTIFVSTLLFLFFSFKSGVNKLTRELQKEFIYWTRKQTAHNTGFV